MNLSTLLPAALIVGSLAYGAGAIAGTYGGTFGNGGTPSAAGGGGSGDITAVGDCTTGACLSSGNTNLTGANFTDNVGIGVTNGTPARSLDLRGDSTRNAVVSTFSGTDNSKLSLVRARGTQASPTVAQSGDTLGQLFFRGQLNTTIDVFGGDTGIYGVATENMSLTNRGSRMDFYATPNGSATAALQMTLSESGIVINDTGLAASDVRAEGDTETHLLFCDASADNVGIGTSAPNFRLSTNLTTSATNNVQSSFQLKTTSTGDMLDGFGGGMLWAIQDTAAVENNIAGISGVRDGADNSGKLVFRTFLTGSSNNRMTLLSTGELGIGDETPDALLDVAGTLRVDGQATFVADPSATGASNASVYVNPATSASNEVLLACADNGTAVFSVDKEGDVVNIGTTTHGSSGQTTISAAGLITTSAGVTATGGTIGRTNANDGYMRISNSSGGILQFKRDFGVTGEINSTQLSGIDHYQFVATTGGGAVVGAPAGYAVRLSGNLSVGVVSPASLSGDVTDYTGCATSSMCRINDGGSARTINSMSINHTSSAVHAPIMNICSVGSNDLTLLHDDGATGTAAMRFTFNGSTNRTVKAGSCFPVIYDPTTARWRSALGT